MVCRRLNIILLMMILSVGTAFATQPTVIYPWGEGTWIDPLMTTDNHNGSWVSVNEPFTNYIRMFHVDSAGAVQCSLSYHGTTELHPRQMETDSAGGFFLLFEEKYYIVVDPDLIPVNRLQVRHYSASGLLNWQRLAVDTLGLAEAAQANLTMLDTTLLLCWHWERADTVGLYCQRINTQSGNLIGNRNWLGPDPTFGFGVIVYGSDFFISSHLTRCLLSPDGNMNCVTSDHSGGMTQTSDNMVFVVVGGGQHRVLVERYENLSRVGVDTLFQEILSEINFIRIPHGIRISWSSSNDQLFTRQWTPEIGWDSTQQLCQDTMASGHLMVATDSGATLIWYYWLHRDHLFAQRINGRHIFWQPDGLALWPLGGLGFSLCSGSPNGIAAWFAPDAGLCVAPVDSLSDNPVGNEPQLAPTSYALSVFPNPFNPSTQIEYDLKQSGYVHLSVYNLLGQRVAILVNGNMAQGRHAVTFDAQNLPSGMYICKMETNGFEEEEKMVVLK